MHTFLFVATHKRNFTQSELASYPQRIKKWMPALNVELAKGLTFLPECKYGWCWLAPAAPEANSLISEIIDDQLAVLAFGDIFNYETRTTAQIIREAWITGGAQQVRQLDGCFSAVIVIRTTQDVILIGDMMGRRRLSYYVSDQTLLVSPHDVTLMATGHIPVEFDWVSLGSVVAVEWSLGGKSLLAHVQTCHPTEYLRWHQGPIERHLDSVIDPTRRVIQQDAKGIASNLDNMIALAQEQARIFINKRSEILCDLSAGFDSRVVWSLLLSVIDNPARVLARSCGEAQCLDVQVARKLSRMYETSFVTYADEPPSPDEFLTHCDLLAFAMNGGTPGKRAIKYPTGFTPHPQTYAAGAGGEIFRGFYYGHHPLMTKPYLSANEALNILWKRNRSHELPWITPDLSRCIHDRLTKVVEDYAIFSENGYDFLDMFYLYERMGVWGSSSARQTWKDPRWSPFLNPSLIKMGYQMPAPIARFAMIHRESLRRLAPRAYNIRINGRELLPLDDWGPISPFLKTFDTHYQRYIKRNIKRILSPFRSQRRDMEQVAADTLSGVLMKTVSDILLSNGSLSQEIFAKKDLEVLFQEHKQKKKDHTETLGLLIAVERWVRLVRGIAEEAKATPN